MDVQVIGIMHYAPLDVLLGQREVRIHIGGGDEAEDTPFVRNVVGEDPVEDSRLGGLQGFLVYHFDFALRQLSAQQAVQSFELNFGIQGE